MTTEDRTQRILQRLAEAAEETPDLSGFYELHQKLFRLQGEARADIAAALELADEEALKARTAQGLPMLSFAQLPIAAGRFATLATAVAAVLSEYDPDLGKQALPDDAAAWLSLAERRFEEGRVNPERAERTAELTLAEMAVDLALKPYLEWAADQVLPHLNLERWKRGYCPVCGGPPDFAVLEEETGARYLICSRCAAEWPFRRLGCPFCNTNDYSKLFYYLSDDEVYRLYVCQECRHYLKSMDLRKATHRVVLEAERVTTVAMDVAAQREGYRS
ncbi:MAG: formate dehydrogenase accessory protein FdhE [Anaerolineae bacterium]|nr:formate dehydrogenase accessory protein FdhE [Anaerolineae bacterium]